MDSRLANTWRLTVNERKFIETALLSGIRVDGRNPYEYRKLSIKFGRQVLADSHTYIEDGSSEVQLGQTHVMGFVTCQLVQPYRDRSNEGTLSIYTEFSPMADPSFEPGRPGESAVELGRIIDRGLRESRAVDTESLCVLAGKLVWAIRIDLHILDNGGNLVDAANIAALAALLTFRRPECSLGGEDGQEVILHPPEEREPLPLIVHHLPIAVTFGFFSSESIVVIDPTYHEEAVMAGRMTATLNANGDVCAIQKPGGEGVLQSVIMQCLRLASRTAGDITTKINDAKSMMGKLSISSLENGNPCLSVLVRLKAYKTERALSKIKRHPTSIALQGIGPGANVKGKQNLPFEHKCVSELSRNLMERSKLASEGSCASQNDGEGETKLSELGGNRRDGGSTNFVGGPASWDPYSKGVDSDFLKASLASRVKVTPGKKQDSIGERKPTEPKPEKPPEDNKSSSPTIDASEAGLQKDEAKTLKDAVKPKHKRKKRASTGANTS
ncbi:hypothetical protein JRO89_XS10G0063000 [Xanthoceras sorbifolium]|uniref:Uncharacterized protein n=1 Tax=Xanthoceras sorbifolium TaxID=99658 RepID=A0ABQ8HHW3_9ROSI|nr:hypothetical protein JRO89_XS10G0063000 [Xanthoceras sorbifolium]